MVSIFIIFSKDRLEQFKITLSCLKEMYFYNQCEKILVCDNEQINFNEFSQIVVPRRQELFCWADAFNAGVDNSKNDWILYLDSDRVLPKNYLGLLWKYKKEKYFIYSKDLIRLKQYCTEDIVKKIRDDKHSYKNEWEPEDRINRIDVIQCKKNPFSGNTFFNKKDYYALGGMDSNFIGWGCPDIDLYLRAIKNKYRFLKLNCTEIHQHHDYNIPQKDFILMNLWNTIKVGKKHKLGYDQDILNTFKKYGINYNLTIENFNDFKSLYY